MDKDFDINMRLFRDGFYLGQGQLPGHVDPANAYLLPEFDGFIVGRVGLGAEMQRNMRNQFPGG